MSSKCGIPGAVASHALQEQLNILRLNASKLCEQDPEALHDTRVATRRIRSILSESEPSWNSEARDAFSLRMREITRKLSKPRELDVCRNLLREIATKQMSINKEALALLDAHCQEQRTEQNPAVTTIADYLESAVFNDEKDTLLAGLRIRTGCYRKMADERIGKRRKNVRKAYEKWTRKHSEETLHRLRIEFKKLRYAYELFQDAFDVSVFGAHLENIREIQRQLGAWHDHHVLAKHAEMQVAQATDKEKALLENACTTLNTMADSLLQTFKQYASTLLESSKKDAFKTEIRVHACKVMHRPKRKNNMEK